MGNEWEKCPLAAEWRKQAKATDELDGRDYPGANFEQHKRDLNRVAAQLESLWSVLKPLLEAGQAMRDDDCMKLHKTLRDAYDAALAAYRERQGKKGT